MKWTYYPTDEDRKARKNGQPREGQRGVLASVPEDAAAELEAYRLLIDLSREDQTR